MAKKPINSTAKPIKNGTKVPDTNNGVKPNPVGGKAIKGKK